jgi:hypothetical protein
MFNGFMWGNQANITEQNAETNVIKFEKHVNVNMWEHCTFDNKIFGRGKIYYSNSIIIIFCVNFHSKLLI